MDDHDALHGGGNVVPLRPKTIDDGEIRLGPARVEPLTVAQEAQAVELLTALFAEGKLERYFEGFEEGRLAADLFQDRVRGHRERLEALREREADLSARLATHAHTPPDGAALARLADQLEAIVAEENPEQAKELLRLLVKDIRVHDRRRIIPSYRIPAAVRATPRKVGGTGLEPVTPSLSRRPRELRHFTAASLFSALCRSFTLHPAARVCAALHLFLQAAGSTW